jgi:hypothetical protein
VEKQATMAFSPLIPRADLRMILSDDTGIEHWYYTSIARETQGGIEELPRGSRHQSESLEPEDAS